MARQHRPLEQRRNALDLTLLDATPRRGWRLVTLTETEAQFVKGHPMSRLLHLILTVCTFGLSGALWDPGRDHDRGEAPYVGRRFGTAVGGKRRAIGRFAKGRTVAR